MNPSTAMYIHSSDVNRMVGARLPRQITRYVPGPTQMELGRYIPLGLLHERAIYIYTYVSVNS